MSAPPGHPACAAGFAVERSDVERGRRDLPRGSPPKPGDLWIDLDGEGCGLVEQVSPDPERTLAIWIRHLRPRDGQLHRDGFYDQLEGRGRFLR